MYYKESMIVNKGCDDMDLEKLSEKLAVKRGLFLGEDTAFRSAVCIPLVEVDGEWHILFEVRAYSMRKQPGDISFPGGKIDADDASPMAAAIRETYEELGVQPHHINIIGELSPYIPSPNFVIYPFVAKMELAELHINAAEVDKIFTVPLSWLLTHEPYKHFVNLVPTPSADFPFDKIANGKNYQWGTRAIDEWFYEYDGHVIWGLTAKILRAFLHTIKM